MDLRLLRYFVAAVDHGSATRAAAALTISQPALSRQLRQLERSFGVALFRPEGRRLTLTRAGEELVEHARSILRHADTIERVAGSLATGSLDRIHLATPSTTFTDVLAPFIATLNDDDPEPILRELDPRGAQAALQAGADLAVVSSRPSRRLASLPLAVLPVWAYVRADDPWAERASIPIVELLERPIIALTQEFRPRMLLDAAVDEAGLAYDTLKECSNAQVAQALAAAGRGVAVVSDDPRFDLVPLTVRSPRGILTITLFAAWEPTHHGAEVLADLAQRLAAFCADRYGDDPIAATPLIGSSPTAESR